MDQQNKNLETDERKAWPIITAMLFFGFVMLSFLALKPSEQGEDVAAIFPPNMSLTEIASVSSGLLFRPVRVGFLDNIVIFKPLSGAKLEDLKQVGALFIVSAIADGGCIFYKNDRKIKA